jgi:hypothetical protein
MVVRLRYNFFFGGDAIVMWQNGIQLNHISKVSSK